MTRSILLAAACLFLTVPMLRAATPETEVAEAAGQVRVAALRGTAKLSVFGSPERTLSVGDTLLPGATVSTGKGAALDLFLGNTGGTLRMTERSRLGVDQFQVGPEGTVTNLQVHLYEGTVLGLGNQLPLTSRYQIQISNGFVGIEAKQFRINANGFIVAMDGTLLFAFIPKEGNAVLHELKAPPPVYFYPGEGIVPAPPELQSEVLAQVQARIR